MSVFKEANKNFFLIFLFKRQLIKFKAICTCTEGNNIISKALKYSSCDPVPVNKILCGWVLILSILRKHSLHRKLNV